MVEEYAKQETSTKEVARTAHSNFLFGLFFDPEDRSDMFLRNVGGLPTDYTTLYQRSQNS
jgi:hypothetical protein